ncbi:MAG TPA: formiminotransferase-cyclodeaminase [Thermotoga sp.]|nr:formiminotransferase-cyclodeaminase [Thermotoga sp.]
MEIREMKIKEFCDKIAEKTPTPGGGAVGAVVAGYSAALIEMVANLTLGKKKYQEWESEMEKIIERMENIREKLMDIAKKDIQAFNEVMSAYKLPKNTEEEKKEREKKIQEALIKAADVPFELARITRDLIKDAEIVTEFGNKNAISDALSSAELCRAVFEIAKANVLINLKYVKDENKKNYYKTELEELENQVYGCWERIKELIKENDWL